MQDSKSRRPSPRGGVIMLVALCVMANVDARLGAQTPVCPPSTSTGNPNVFTGQYDLSLIHI